jgi:hypothetical protein
MAILAAETSKRMAGW